MLGAYHRIAPPTVVRLGEMVSNQPRVRQEVYSIMLTGISDGGCSSHPVYLTTL